MVESDPLAVLFDRHSLDVSVLHGELLLLFENNFLLPTLFDAKLQNLHCVLNEIMLYIMIDLCVSSKTGHMIYFKHPWFELVIKHDVEAKKVTA